MALSSFSVWQYRISPIESKEMNKSCMWSISLLPCPMMQLRYNSERKPQHTWQNEGINFVICGNTKKKQEYKTKKMLALLIPLLSPCKIWECQVPSCFLLLSPKTISYATTVQFWPVPAAQPWGPQSISLSPLCLLHLTRIAPPQTNQKL